MFPSILNTFNRPAATDRLNSPSHSALHNTVSSALGQVQAVIGVDGATSVVGTMMYDLRSPGSGGGGHVQTANKGGTGQTTYTKGDILIATSSSVLTKLAVGLDNQALFANSSVAAGVNWAGFPLTPTVRTYSSVVTIWNRPSTLTYAIIEVIGGGGAGVAGVDSGSTGYGGGGGGGGGYSKKTVRFADLPIAASVYGAPASVMSYFGTVVTATGGQAGSARTGGDPGLGAGGDINISGSSGAPGIFATTTATESGQGGNGGNSFYGGGGKGAESSGNAGGNGRIYGGGGGGGAGNGGGSSSGGSGFEGIVIITEY